MGTQKKRPATLEGATEVMGSANQLQQAAKQAGTTMYAMGIVVVVFSVWPDAYTRIGQVGAVAIAMAISAIGGAVGQYANEMIEYQAKHWQQTHGGDKVQPPTRVVWRLLSMLG